MYIEISLKWDYEKGMVKFQYQDMYAQPYMLSNTRYQNDDNNHHNPGHNMFIGRTIRCYQKKHQLRNWMKINIIC